MASRKGTSWRLSIKAVLRRLVLPLWQAAGEGCWASRFSRYCCLPPATVGWAKWGGDPADAPNTR